MKKTLLPYRIMFVISLFQLVCIVAIAQQKSDETVLTNDGIIELVKAGLSENIILTKIKNSKSEFDTSSSALVKLKESGLSDIIIMAMIEAKPKTNNSTESEILLEMKDAVGKKKVFVESEDEKSQLIIIKTLKKNGFEIVVNEQDAELL